MIDHISFIKNLFTISIFRASLILIELLLFSWSELSGIAATIYTVGSSTSFSRVDAAAMISSDKALTDAADTMRENAVQADGALGGCYRAMDEAGVDGALVIRGEENGVVGVLPWAACIHLKICPQSIIFHLKLLKFFRGKTIEKSFRNVFK